MEQPINFCSSLANGQHHQLYFLPAMPFGNHGAPRTDRDTPESSEEPNSTAGKKVYNCQRCLNHGIEVKRRNHKSVCPFTNCVCSACEMVSARSVLNSEFAMECEDSIDPDIEIDVVDLDEDTVSGGQEVKSSQSEDREEHSGAGKTEKEGGKVRDPHCQQCAAHGKNYPLKNHKKICPYKNCECKKCKIVFRRRTLMAKQIKLRRQQKQKKQMESAANELRKQLEKAAERQHQAIFSFWPLPEVGSLVHNHHFLHQHVHAGDFPFPGNNCWSHPPAPCNPWVHNSGATVPSIASLQMINNVAGNPCHGPSPSHFLPSSHTFRPNLHIMPPPLHHVPERPCLECLRARSCRIAHQPPHTFPPSTSGITAAQLTSSLMGLQQEKSVCNHIMALPPSTHMT